MVGVKVTPANVPDGDVLIDLVEACNDVTRVMGDSAYGSGDLRANMKEQDIELVAKVPHQRRGVRGTSCG